jgi:ankyrin repeat protein
MFSAKKIKPEKVWKGLAQGDIRYFEKHKGKLLALNLRDARFDESLLHRACYFGQLHIVEFLIAEGFSVNDDEGELGSTPLHSAAAGNHIEIVK